MLEFNIISLFPNLFIEHLAILPFKRAIEKKTIKVNLINLRDFPIDKRGSVDDKPYSGGTGMLLRIEPIYKALQQIYPIDLNVHTSIKDVLDTKTQKVILLAPAGKTYNQQHAQKYTTLKEITIICGRYEGVDARVGELLATDIISIGNYVLSGGEIAALAIMESITRLLPGSIEKADATQIESFTKNGKINTKYKEFPQYTRPEDFMGHKVPELLLSGDHAKINDWKDKDF